MRNLKDKKKMHFDKQDIQKLKDLPIESVAQRLGLGLSHHKALCPFHDDTHPSLSFSVAKNSFRCFVCGAHGSTIDIAMQVLGKPFAEACEWLANENNIILADASRHKPKARKEPEFDPGRYQRYFEHPWLSDEARRFLHDQRRIDPRVTSWCRLTSWKEWLQIPYYDIGGKLLGVQWRYMGNDKSQPRFRFPKGSRCGIYNLPVLRLLREGEPLFITEGCSDCWAMLSSGHKAIAVPSATMLKGDDMDRLSASSGISLKDLNVHMFPDADVPGEKLFLQLKDHLPRLMRHQLPSGYKDFAQYWAAEGRGVNR